MKKLIFFVLCLSFSALSAKTSTCLSFLSDHEISMKDLGNTEKLVSYLGYLRGQNIIGGEELKNLIKEIENQEELSNPVPHKVTPQGMTFLRSMDGIHYDSLQEYLKQKNLDRETILKWAKNILQESERESVRRNEKQKKTKNPFYEMEFHRVKGRGAVRHDLEVMSTPVTQGMWVDEMGENPAHNKIGFDSVVMLFKGKPIQLKPDHAVESVTWYSAAMFANRISIKNGLPEVYDFSDVEFKPGTSAEKGDLDIASGEIKINASSIHDTLGFRLPTEIEQYFLFTDCGRSTTDFFTGVTTENLHEYAWFDIYHSEAIRLKKPLVIDGKNFFDLYGNVYEWGNDESNLPYTTHPRKKTQETYRFAGGGRWGPENTAHSMNPTARRYFDKRSNSRSVRLGFRLVRTVK